MPPVDDVEVVTAMRQYGGSFVRCLSLAFMAADPENFAKLRAAFPEYWQNYTTIATEEKAKRADPAEPLL